VKIQRCSILQNEEPCRNNTSYSHKPTSTHCGPFIFFRPERKPLSHESRNKRLTVPVLRDICCHFELKINSKSQQLLRRKAPYVEILEKHVRARSCFDMQLQADHFNCVAYLVKRDCFARSYNLESYMVELPHIAANQPNSVYPVANRHYVR